MTKINIGPRAFYTSYPVTLCISIPFQTIHFATYEFVCDHLNPHRSTYSPTTHVVAGACAGAVAAAVTTPLDVVKTLLQTRGAAVGGSGEGRDFGEVDEGVKRVKGLRDGARLVWQRFGFAGFFRGLVPRVVTFIPATAISWTTVSEKKCLFLWV